ncbi:ABC transporter permease [Actinomadura sp. HBU206391]|uniref:ABC transporter permease n=1 Tax=Actinomadura sp. HBU206391 TaxID=2731692 RepID=UPI0016501366|nr:ABC transporter permease [Actinomadura sp. HBU206391]MBC6462304.1 ABC transporter permease [Actinomadura sp. HBU206391]
MLAYVRLEMMRLFRDGGYLFMTLITPVAMYLVFTNLKMGATDGHDSARYSMVGMAGFGAVGAALTNGIGVAEDKTLGWIRQLRLLPLSPPRVVLGRTMCAMVVAVPPIVAVCLAGAVVNGVSLSIGRWAAVIGLLWLGIAPVALLGMGIGYRLGAQNAQAAGAFCYFGLSLVGGLWFPVTLFPHWLSSVSELTPINRYGELSWRVVDGHAPSLTGAAVLAAWAAGFTAFAVLAYRHSARAT